MRVLFVTHAFPRFAGDPAGSFVLRLAVALRDEGIAVRVLAPAAAGLAPEDEIEGVPVRRFRYAPSAWETLAYEGTMVEQVKAGWPARLALLGMLGAAAPAVRRAAREFGADLVHAHWWFPSGILAENARVIGGPPFVMTLHGSDARLALAVRPARAVFRRLVRRSRGVSTVSRWLAARVREAAPGVEPLVGPMPVDVARFEPGGPRAVDRLLFVGRLNAQKGLRHAIDALALLRPAVSLDVVGDGPDAPALHERAVRLGLRDRVRWFGARPHHELPALYQSAAALVVPSEEEGLGLVAAEAGLCGTPVIAFDSGGLPDLVLDGVTGRLVAERTPAALALAVEDVLADPDRAAAMGEAGRRHAMATVSPPTVARRYADFYRAALR